MPFFSRRAATRIGASAPIFGLLGALVYYGQPRRQQHGALGGDELRRDAVRVRPDHARASTTSRTLGGFAGGYLASMWLDPLKRERMDHFIGAAICLLATARRSSIVWSDSAEPVRTCSLMRKPVVVITGAGGEIGHGLIDRLAERGDRRIVTIDISRLDASIARKVDREVTGSIIDRPLLERLMAEFEVDLIFHLAALLSTRSEFTPIAAHQVNVEGTLHLLEFAQHEAESHGRPVVFLYPSSIAAYGLPDLATKDARRQGPRGRVPAPDDDVRLQQAVLRAARRLLRAALQAAGGRDARAARSISAACASPA